MNKPWWEEWKGRLEAELKALRQVCSKVELVFTDAQTGIAGVNAIAEVGGLTIPLRIEFLSEYPYVRPMLFATENVFQWHQNPFGKNLCLLGTAADNWSSNQTAATLIAEQLPKLIRANGLEDGDSAAELEDIQAEPFSVFLTYQPNSSVLLLGELQTAKDNGVFACACEPFQGEIRGAVTRADFYSTEPMDVSRSLESLGYSSTLQGRWFRLRARPDSANAKDVLQRIEDEHPDARRHNWTRYRDRNIELIAVVVPEEVRWRETAETVVFIMVELKKRGTAKPEVDAVFLRRQVADSGSLLARIPEIGNLSDRRVLLAGAGSLGGPCALELARVGLGSLHLVDGDLVEAGNAVRWPLGIEYAGRFKVRALAEHIHRNCLRTEVKEFPVALGTQAMTLSVREQMYADIDLILDATADRGISLILAERAKKMGVPYVCVSSTEGNWGGMVLNLRPSRTTSCWWCFMKRLDEGSLPSPPAGPSANVQVVGCASPTFEGTMFDSGELSLQAIRCVMGDLAANYPQYPWDYGVLSLRTTNGYPLPPTWETAVLTPHPECPRFHEHLAD